MGYIAKIALSHSGRFIKVGDKVPPNYKRFEEGIRRGWIEVTTDPAASNLPTVGSTETIVPEDPPEYVEPKIEDLDYLMPMAKKSLAEKGIIRIGNLEGWDAEALHEIYGIGAKLAERLLSDYAEYAEWKEAFVEYAPIDIGTKVELLPPENEDAEGEIGEPGEDENPQDD